AQAARGAAQRRGDDVVDLEGLAELARVELAARAHDAGGANAQRAGRRQRVDQIVEQAVGEVLVAGAARDRQDGDRGGCGDERGPGAGGAADSAQGGAPGGRRGRRRRGGGAGGQGDRG